MVGSMPEPKTVAAIFQTEDEAAEALARLREEHFDLEREVTVLVSRGHERERVPIRLDRHVWRAAPIGAAIGAVLAGAGVALAGLTSGPFTMIPGGPLYAVLEAAYAGGAAGFAIGALMTIDLVTPKADFSVVRIRDGAVWVGVQAEGAHAERARRILAGAGARHFALPRLAPVAV